MGHPPVRARSPRTLLRRVNVRPPRAEASTDALFILMRRMRGPLVLLALILAVDVYGLTLMPGTDDQGRPYYMTVFDAFYFISYTAATIGYGETPYTFSVAQRMWTTFAIYSSVLGWAYAIGVFLTLLQDRAFQDAVALQRFSRQVRLLREPFLIIAGYGQMGRRIAETLDGQGRRLVVIDTDTQALDTLAGGKLRIDVPGIDGDARDPRTLTLAGLTHPYCEGVLAMTHDDSVNVAVVMAVQLLRPEVPVYARADDPQIGATMRDFRADAIINPYDRYGDYLALRLQRPTTYRLVTWLLAAYDTPLEDPRRPGTTGRWIVVSDDRFGEAIAGDLRAIGAEVHVIGGHELPDTVGAVGVVAGTSDENRNLAVAAHARLKQPETFIAVRARSEALAPLLKAFGPDSVFIPAKLTAEEALARVVTPDFWAFFQHAFGQDEAWSEDLLERFVARQGTGSPTSRRFVLDKSGAPGLVTWLGRHTLTVGDLLRDPADRDARLGVVPLMLTRGGRDTFVPPDDMEVRVGDELVLAGHDASLDAFEQNLFHAAGIEYVATGETVPTTWLFRLISPRVQDAAGG